MGREDSEGDVERSGAIPIEPRDRRIEERRQNTVRVFTGSILVIGILYVARQVFIPVALAVLFAFLLRPVVRVLERSFLRQTGAIVVSIALAVGLLSVAAWTLSLQVNSLAREVAAYSGNLEQKLKVFHASSGGSLAIVERTLQRLAETAEPQEKPDFRVKVIPERKTIADRYRAVAPSFELLASAFLVIVLVFFLLSERERLRDRLLRLAGRAHLTVTTQAIGEATYRISRYLFTLAFLNFLFGTAIFAGLFLFGVPHSLLWGVLAGLLRFIPYIGAVLAAAFPTILSLAVFPNWYVPVAVIALFGVTDQILAGFVEPLVIGHRTGVSPTALLISTIFWGWLWGPVGLLLSVPITVCLTVIGEFIPAFSVFSVLFATEAPLEDYLGFYNRLISRDRIATATFVDRFAEEEGMQEAFVQLFIPTLEFAAEELSRERITKAQDHFIKDIIRELIIRLGDRNAHVLPGAPRMVAFSVGGERISLGTMMLAQLLRSDGYGFDFFTDLEEEEVIAFVHEAAPLAVFVTCSHPSRLQEGCGLVHLLRQAEPETLIVAAGSAFGKRRDRTLETGADFVIGSLVEAKQEILARIATKGRTKILA
ncbi:MAG: AI-2E family transporter [Thermoanaerobaculia bacterium]